MFENIIVTIIRQAGALTKPQQADIIARAADLLAEIIRNSETKIDDTLLRELVLPMAAQLVNALGERV